MSNNNELRLTDFDSLNLDQKKKVELFVNHFHAYSDFNFTSMYAWNTENKLQISTKNRNLSVLFQDYETKDCFFSFLGVHLVNEHINQLVQLSISCGFGNILRLVPKTVIDSIENPDSLIIAEDRDNFDYILSVDHIAGLSGGKNEDRRYKIKKFVSIYGDEINVRYIDITKPQYSRDIMKCLYEWKKMKNLSIDKNLIENTAIRRLISVGNELSVECMSIYIKDAIVAFCIYEKVDNETGIIHFEKCLISYTGIASYIRHLTAVRFQELGVKYINYEQDLGIPGLRKSKEMLHPIRYLKKYTITPKV